MPEQRIPAPLPVIRTLADDLASAARGEPIPVDLPGLPGLPPSARGGRRSTEVSGLAPLPPLRAGRGRIIRFLLILLALLVVGAGSWVGFRFVSRSSGSIADVLPAEALAFVSVQTNTEGKAGQVGASPLAERVRSHIAAAIGIQAEGLAGASEIAYVLLRGSTPTEPITALFVRGVETVDLSAVPEFGFRSFRGGIFITKNTDLGRLEGLSGRTWSSEKELLPLFHGLPSGAHVLVAFQSHGLVPLLQPLVPLVSADRPLVLAITGVGGDVGRVVIRTSGSWQPARDAGPTPTLLVGKLPAESALVLQRPAGELAGDFLAGRETTGTTGSAALVGLDAFRRSLGQQSGVIRDLVGSFGGPGVVGVLPTLAPGIRDIVAVLPVKSGADPLPLLRAAESAFRELGPPLAGSSFPDAAFVETDYAGVRLRYMNFGSPARAFDYAVVGDTLLIGTSRESMRALIDTARGSRASLAGHPAYMAVADQVRGGEWIFLRSDPALVAETPPPYARIMDLLLGLVVRPTAPGGLEGAVALQKQASTSVPGEFPAFPGGNASGFIFPGGDVPPPAPLPTTLDVGER